MNEKKTFEIDEHKKEILKKALETGEISDSELEEVSGGDCTICTTCMLSGSSAAAKTAATFD